MNKLKDIGTFGLLKDLMIVYVLKYKKSISAAITLMILSAVTTSGYAYLMGSALDKIFVDKNKIALWLIPMVIIIIGITKNIAIYTQSILMSITVSKVRLDIQYKLYKKFLYSDLKFFYIKTSGDMVSHIVNDINIVTSSIQIILVTFIRELLTVVFLISFMFWRNWQLASVSLILVPLILLVIRYTAKKIKQLANRSMSINAGFITIINDTLSSIKTLKAYSSEEFESKRFKHNLVQMFKMSNKVSRISLASSPLVEIISTISIAIMIFFGGWQVINGIGNAGDFLSFIMAMGVAYKPLKSLSGINTTIQFSAMSYKRIRNILIKENQIFDKENAIKLTDFNEIKFDNVSFAYNGNLDSEIVINKMNFILKKGQKIAFVGKSGGGKTTITNLLLRLFDVTDGRIKIDDIDIRDCTIKSIRKLYSIVTQDIQLFNDTIENNIKYNLENITKEQIIKAAKLAHADEFIDKMSNGYNTLIGQSGMRLSGGQKQRIAIARAILQDKPILILDEATSALDSNSERLIKDALEKFLVGKTAIIIAHRLSTIKNVDIVYVIKDGRIIESGSHTDLIAKDSSGDYKKMYEEGL